MKAKLLKVLLVDVLLLVVAVALVSLLYKQTVLLTIIMVAGWAIALKLWHSKNDIATLLAGAVAGTLAESIAVMTGAWKYANPTLLGIPLWLPLLWGGAAMFIRKFADTLASIWAEND